MGNVDTTREKITTRMSMLRLDKITIQSERNKLVKDFKDVTGLAYNCRNLGEDGEEIRDNSNNDNNNNSNNDNNNNNNQASKNIQNKEENNINKVKNMKKKKKKVIKPKIDTKDLQSMEDNKEQETNNSKLKKSIQIIQPQEQYYQDYHENKKTNGKCRQICCKGFNYWNENTCCLCCQINKHDEIIEYCECGLPLSFKSNYFNKREYNHYPKINCNYDKVGDKLNEEEDNEEEEEEEEEEDELYNAEDLDLINYMRTHNFH